MSYVDGIWDRDKDIIRVVERDPKKGRIFQDYPAKYVLYYPDSKGKYRSIYGDPLSKVSVKNYKEFQKETRIHSGKKLFEEFCREAYRDRKQNIDDADMRNIYNAANSLSYEQWIWFVND
jgi:hypothetical protein